MTTTNRHPADTDTSFRAGLWRAGERLAPFYLTVVAVTTLLTVVLTPFVTGSPHFDVPRRLWNFVYPVSGAAIGGTVGLLILPGVSRRQRWVAACFLLVAGLCSVRLLDTAERYRKATLLSPFPPATAAPVAPASAGDW